MAYNSQKVVQMISEKGIKSKDFIAYVYPENSGNRSISYVRSTTNPKADTLERMANLLDCSIDYLFDRDNHYTIKNEGNRVIGDNNSVGNIHINSDPELLMATINHLRDVITRQDKTIDELNHRIDQLIDLAKQQN